MTLSPKSIFVEKHTFSLTYHFLFHTSRTWSVTYYIFQLYILFTFIIISNFSSKIHQVNRKNSFAIFFFFLDIPILPFYTGDNGKKMFWYGTKKKSVLGIISPPQSVLKKENNRKKRSVLCYFLSFIALISIPVVVTFTINFVTPQN